MDSFGMNILDVIVWIIRAGAWPAAAVTIVLILKNDLAGLLSHVKEFEAGPVKLKLDKLLTDSREQAKNIKSELGEKIKRIAAGQKEKMWFSSVSDQAALIADISPLAAIPFAYSQLENEIIRELPAVDTRETEINFANDFPLDLFKSGKIGKNTLMLFNTAKAINDEVVFNKGLKFNITKQDAVDYSKIIETLIAVIDEHREL